MVNMNRAERRRTDKLRRRGKLKYIKNDPFMNVKGEPYRIQNESGNSDEADVGMVLRLLMNVYQPSEALQLDIADLRKYNKILDILEGKPQEDGYYRFEDNDFDLMKRVALHFAPLVLIRNAPLVDDILNNDVVDIVPELSDSTSDKE